LSVAIFWPSVARHADPPWPPSKGARPPKECPCVIGVSGPETCQGGGMRLTQYRINVHANADGMISVVVAEIEYQRGKAHLVEILHNDWCLPEELYAVVEPILDRAAREGLAISNDLVPQLPL